MDGKIINLQWREDYHYGLYNHRLISKDGITYTRSFIVIKNRFGVIVRFTNLHNYAGVYENKVFVPIASDAEAKLHYICMMLNYVLIKHYNKFRIDHVFKINREALECFFRDYATEKLPNGKYRGEQSVEKCVYTITGFFRKLRRKFGGHLLLAESDLYTETKVYSKYGKFQKTKRIPAFQVRGISKTGEAFRELPTNAFKILLNLAFGTRRTLLSRSAYRHSLDYAQEKSAMSGRKAAQLVMVLCLHGLRVGQLKLKLILRVKYQCAATVLFAEKLKKSVDNAFTHRS